MKIPRALLTHPFELCISFSVFLMGLQTLGRGEALSAAAEKDLIWALALIWQVGIILGSGTVLLALFARGPVDNLKRRIIWRAVERCGLYLTAASAWTYAVVIAARGSGSGYAVAIMTGVGAACVLRTVAIRRGDQDTLQAVRDLASGAR